MLIFAGFIGYLFAVDAENKSLEEIANFDFEEKDKKNEEKSYSPLRNHEEEHFV